MANGNSITAIEYRKLLLQNGDAPDHIIQNVFGIPAEAIRENVIISPGWVPERLFPPKVIRELSASTPLFAYRIYEVSCDVASLTWIKNGFGAPVNLDAVLLLGLTDCKTVLFVSSAGSLSSDMDIGDLTLPEYSLSGDGATRYLAKDITSDSFGSIARPNRGLFLRAKEIAEAMCDKASVKLHISHPFCTDTILAEQRIYGFARERGADAWDMESAAVFFAANTANISAAAILQISDVPRSEKTLFNGRGNEAERKYRRHVQREVLPQIITQIMFNKNPNGVLT